MFESFRRNLPQATGIKRKTLRLFLEELEGRCLLSHAITPVGGIAAAPDGSLWFPEGDRLGRIDPSTGVIQEFLVGTPTSDIAAGPDGSIWFTSGHQIDRFDPSTQGLEKFDFSAGSIPVFGNVVDSNGNLWALELYQDKWAAIIRIDPNSGNVHETIVFEGAPMGGGIAFGRDGSTYFSFGGIGKINSTTGAVEHLTTVGPTADIIAGPEGNLWYTEFGPPDSPLSQLNLQTGQVIDFDLFRSIRIDGGGNRLPPQVQLGLQNGPMVTDSNGNLWLAAGPIIYLGDNSERIVEFSPSSGAVKTFEVPYPQGVSGFTIGSNGNIWFSSQPGAIGELNPNTGAFQFFSTALESATQGTGGSSNTTSATGTNISASAGINFMTAVAAFTPQTPIASPGQAYQATIDWGDGSFSSLVLTVTDNATYDVTAGHTYQTAGTYSIKVTIGNYNSANPLGDNVVTVFGTANVQVFDFNPFG